MAHVGRQELLDQINDTSVLPGQRYQHYKTKGIYIVKEIVILEATDEPAIAYYDEDFPDLTWIRPYQDFTAVVDNQPRFSLLS